MIHRFLSRVPPKWRRRLDNIWVWTGIAYFAIVALVVFGIWLNGRTSQAQADSARNEAIRMAEQRAGAESVYQRCVGSIIPTKRVSTHVAGVNEAFQVLLTNSIRNHHATPTTSPQYRAQEVNIRNLRKAIRKVAAVKSFPAPSLKDCKERRVDALRGIKP